MTETPAWKTDGADARTVLLGILECANTWVGDARIIGNVRAEDITRAIIDILSTPSADDWQPIETAPKDGSVFLAATTRAQRPTACMCKVESGKFLVLSKGEKFEGQGWAQWWPTHWQPLPPSPKPAVSEGGEDE